MLMCLQFDKFLLCPTEKIILCGEIKLDIRGKDFEVLHLLLRYPKRLVRKEVFLQEVWRGVTVEEANIAVCVNNIRKALRTYSERPLIETVWGEGYRLLVDVVEVDKEAEQFNLQPEAPSNSGLTQRENKAGKPQARQYKATPFNLRILTDNRWDVALPSIIALSAIIILSSSIFSGSNVVKAALALIALTFFALWALYEHKGKKKVRVALTEAKNQRDSLQQLNIELRKKIDSETMRADQAEEAYRKLSEDFEHRLEYRVSKLEIRVNIKDYDGYCHTRWIWTDITKKRPDAIISRMPGGLRFSTPGCSIKQYPLLSSRYERDYKLHIVTKEANFCEFYVHAIEPTDKMSYEYVADIDKAFCMGDEELTGRLYEYEWFGYHVISAIEVLVINLSFPDYYKPTGIQPDAYLGFFPTELSDNSEVERIIKEKGFDIAKNGAISMTVNKPKIGHHYCVRWKPLPSVLVEAMRQRQSK